MNLSHAYGAPISEAQAERVLLTALDAGVTFFDQAQNQFTAQDHDGDADKQANDDQRKVAIGSTSDTQDVVDPHQSVSHNNRLHGTPESGGA